MLPALSSYRDAKPVVIASHCLNTCRLPTFPLSMTSHPTLSTSQDDDGLECQQLHEALLAIYRSLIRQERMDYERLHGEQSEDDFIQVLAYAESLRWLDGLTRLVVMLQLFEDASEHSHNASRVVARKLLGMVARKGGADGDFGAHYHRHLAASTEFAAAHDQLLTVLNRFALPLEDVQATDSNA